MRRPSVSRRHANVCMRPACPPAMPMSVPRSCTTELLGGASVTSKLTTGLPSGIERHGMRTTWLLSRINKA
ncbi:hypothetical protein MAA44156_02758 [Mycobacterium avium subsp. avium]|nr:hypothetical protein MAA44156_02758 [Mycobacterium avium subsp. avium]